MNNNKMKVENKTGILREVILRGFYIEFLENLALTFFRKAL